MLRKSAGQGSKLEQDTHDSIAHDSEHGYTHPLHAGDARRVDVSRCGSVSQAANNTIIKQLPRLFISPHLLTLLGSLLCAQRSATYPPGGEEPVLFCAYPKGQAGG